ncbi:MAG: ABC-three component system protein [Nitrospirota bacterium]
MSTPTKPLTVPPTPTGVPADFVATGLPIPAIERIRIFSDRQWEEFVLEWASSLNDDYGLVERCGGAGDMGRDIVAYYKNDDSMWDNYQCKHYKNALTPSDIWVELGKLIYYTYRKEYSYPRRYFFVAQQGAGTKLSNLLKKKDKLRTGLLDNWDKLCRNGISSTAPVELDKSLKKYIDSLDFSIFQTIPPLKLIEQHAKTRWHVARFGGGLPARPSFEPPPEDVAAHEVIYVRELLNAYSDHLKRNITSVVELTGEEGVHDHFNDSRLEFYSAEALRLFSRDTLPPGEFEKLQKEVHSGIKDEIRGAHKDGFRRVMAVVKTARVLQLSGHALNDRLSVRDRGGICHQLANDKKVRWVK